MSQEPFYNSMDVRGVVNTLLTGKLMGAVTTMPTADSKNAGYLVVYVGTKGTYIPGTIYLNTGTAWVAQGKIVTVDSTVSGTSDNPVSGKAVSAAISNVSSKLPIVGTNLSVTWASNTSVAGYSYRGTITLAGVTVSHVPVVTFDTAQASSGNYSPVAESGAGVVYIWSKTNTAITIPSVVATL